MAGSWWLETIGRIPLLTPAEEIELGTIIQRWQQHPEPCPPGIRRRGMRARDRFVQANLRLAVNYVTKRCHRLSRLHGGVEDLIQAANEGLIKGVERFDPARGYRFSTYGYWWIRQAVNTFANTQRSIAIPGSHSQHLGRLAAIERRLAGELNRPPTPDEIAEALGCSVAVLDQVIENGRPIGSLDQVITDDGLELSSLVATYDKCPEDAEAEAERWRQAEQLRNLIARLPNSDRRLLSLAYGLDGVEIPRSELAQQEGLSTRALESKLQRLQASLASHSVQLVLVAVCRVRPSPRPRMKRKRRGCVGEQLVLVVVV